MARRVGPEGARDRVVTTKLTSAQEVAWIDLLDDMGATGPRPREADALRWLIEQEVRRRGRAWPGAAPDPAKGKR